MTSRERRMAKARAIQARQDITVLGLAVVAILAACLPIFLM